MTLSITIRAATQDELERTDSTEKADLENGAFAILRDGALIGITNEYGTAVYCEGLTNAANIEGLAEDATRLWL